MPFAGLTLLLRIRLGHSLSHADHRPGWVLLGLRPHGCLSRLWGLWMHIPHTPHAAWTRRVQVLQAACPVCRASKRLV